MENLAILHQHTDIALFILRAAIALIFLVHGLWKIQNGKQAAEGSGMPGSGWFFTFLGWLEFLGALALLAGIITQPTAAVLGLVMIGAIYFKIWKWQMPFTAHDKTGWEFDLIILAACIMVVIAGAGKIALDNTVFGLY